MIIIVVSLLFFFKLTFRAICYFRNIGVFCNTVDIHGANANMVKVVIVIVDLYFNVLNLRITRRDLCHIRLCI